MMLTDPATHEAVANRPVKGAKPDGPFYRLNLPADVQISLAPFTCAGVQWAQITLPLPGDTSMHAVS